MNLTTEMPEALKDAKVCNLFDDSLQGWDEDVLKDICNERDRELIKQILIPRRVREDSWFWLLEEKGDFTVRSCYKRLRGEQHCPDRIFWKKIWGLALPDAACLVGSNRVEFGCVVRDERGRFVRSKTNVFTQQMQPREAEAMGLKEALSWVKEWRHNTCVFECDAKLLVDAVNGVAEKIEEATKPKDLETTRMKRAGKVFKDPRLGDRFPEFLLQATEPSEEGPSQVLRTKQRPGAYFQPAWGIRGKDSIVGSTALSKEWSKHSISPVDYQDFVLQQDLVGNELFEAQALATANAHFQGAIHQAKAWKVGLEDANKKLEEASQKREALEAQLASSTSDLETARAENVILKAQKDKSFDGWMDTQEFKDLMVEHDALLHPVSYKEGWDAAVEAIQDDFPEVLEQSSFPCPVRVSELGGVTEKLADMIKDGEEEDSSEEEFEPVTKKARVEEPPRAAPQQPASPAEGTSTGTS
ncbi:uncharacterized protein LOC141714670 [Apium graveolens]|uniref:uncharacterized protein LOC141714670 n=1 Tax=Apium graveolens TaxID=4045 RepID=UPI003D7BFB65